MGIRPLSLAFLTLALLPASAAANTRIIVKRDGGLTAAERADIRADAGVRYVESLPLPRTEVVKAAPGDVRSALRELNADPDVVYAEPDRVVHATGIPDDPEFPKQWGLHNLGDPVDGWAGTPLTDADMDLPDAWDASTGTGVTVAVVDTGVDDAHPDLAGRVLPGYDWVDNDPDADDESVSPVPSHGTHVAGIIAATMNNDPLPLGVAGVAPDARILPLRVLDANGSGRVSDIVKAYDFAGDRGIRIVNASFSDTIPSDAEREAIDRHPTTLFVVGAGNRGADLDVTADEYPCEYGLANIVCVGASQPDDTPLPDSNYGETTVDVFAPGTRIYSTMRGGGYDYKTGTSMATAHISGAAALLLARTPVLTVASVKKGLIDWSQSIAALDGYSVSDGRANVDDSMIRMDSDRDGTSDKEDSCPADPDPCDPLPPDADGDGVAIPADKCPYEAAAYAADGCPGVGPDADGDGWPDVFDVTPRGVDVDGDGVPALDDACPNEYGTLSNGCPAPPTTPTPSPTPSPIPPANRDGDDRVDTVDFCPTEYAITNDGCPLPQVASLTGRVRKRGTQRSVTVKVGTTRLAMVRVTIERRKRGRWVRVARATRGTVANRVTVTARGLKRGRHRVRVAVSSGAGSGTPVSTRFRVP